MNTLRRLLVPAALATLLSACVSRPPTTPESGATTVAPKAAATPQLQLKLGSGTYRCDLGRRVELRRDAQDSNRIEIGWEGNRYGLIRLASSSGLPRYEDRRSGLVWIDLPWKGVLLDGNSGQPLANECKLS